MKQYKRKFEEADDNGYEIYNDNGKTLLTIIEKGSKINIIVGDVSIAKINSAKEFVQELRKACKNNNVHDLADKPLPKG